MRKKAHTIQILMIRNGVNSRCTYHMCASVCVSCECRCGSVCIHEIGETCDIDIGRTK